MENNYNGDLGDIFRPGSANKSSIDPAAAGVVPDHHHHHHWQYFDDDDDHQSSRSMIIHEDELAADHEGFGQPFTSLLTDPLITSPAALHHHHHQGTTSSSSSSCFFGNSCSNTLVVDEQQQQQQQQQQPPSSSTTTARLIPLGFDHHLHHPKMVNVVNHNHNIFSKMLQISPNINASKSIPNNNNNEMIITSSSSNSSSSATKRGLLMEASTTSTSLQISSPRNPGIKRRKSQAKKVVCIPAPAPANSRPTGEVVPSDLWAWRKYGQKPIKGSPYPRGYYRCSSSKGCSARKQVERSRTDPNMLVITYTSEHNHPWPTQRNALAGSTRTPQPPKTTTNDTNEQQQPQQEMITTEDEGSTLVVGNGVLQVKDELQIFEGAFPAQGYRPELPGQGEGDGGQQQDDFFSGLGEIDVDPISMLLNQGFLGGDEEAENYNKDLDPFG